jgi:uncharacterized phage protein (TIGR01671 family)
MRDYLFRGKSRFSGKWVYGSLIHVGEFCCILTKDDGTDFEYPYLDGDLGIIDGNAIPVIPETVGQYTGIRDKTGDKIFEGDIVNAFMDYGPAGFRNATVDIGYKKLSGYRWEYFDMESIVVIGNVYDNPELLNREE